MVCAPTAAARPPGRGARGRPGRPCHAARALGDASEGRWWCQCHAIASREAKGLLPALSVAIFPPKRMGERLCATLPCSC